MDTVLSIAAMLGLIVCAGGGFLMAVGTKGFTLRVPSGPDAMGIVVFFILSVVQWIGGLIGAVLVGCRGVLGWLANPAGAGAILLAFATIALGGLSFLSMVYSLERKPGRTVAGWVGAFGLPVGWSAYLLVLAWMDLVEAQRAEWVRWAALPFGVMAVGSVVLVLVLMYKSQAAAADRLARARVEAAERDEKNRRDAAARDAKHKAELEALADDAPLAVFVRHLFIDKSDGHHRLALERIAGLPDLAERFAEELRHPEPLQREYLLNFFRVSPTLDAGLIAALRPEIAACFDRLAADFDAAREQGRAGEVKHVRGMALGLILSAQKFGVRFEEGARRLRAALERWDGHSKDEALALVDRYLAGETIEMD